VSSGFLTHKAKGGVWVASSHAPHDSYDFVQSRQPMIGTVAASEVQHMSGSYAAMAPGTNLRSAAFCLFKLPATLKLVLGSSP